MSESQFKAPSYTSEYLNKVKSRCDQLIRAGVWDIRRTNLNGWIRNFNTEEELYLCANLLDSLIYRSSGMIDSLCLHAVESILPNNISRYPENIDTWRGNLSSGKMLETKFVAVEGIKNGKKETGKSGQTVLRCYHNSGAIHKTNFVDASQLLGSIEKFNVERIVYVDDFCGTGSQFQTFYEHFKFDQIPSTIEQFYIPFACHEEAITRVFQTAIRDVHVCPVEQFTSRSTFFYEQNGTFRGDGENSVISAKSFYEATLRSRKIFAKNPFGIGSLALTYATKVSTPNNTLPIFWTNKNGWIPLLIR